ncbi:type II toxin-antitoxin system HigB family toxin (plasmid) [Methylobacterium sp. P31]
MAASTATTSWHSDAVSRSGSHPSHLLTAWYTSVSQTEWTGPDHLKSVFGSVDFVADNRAIFNVGGNNYRVIARFAYAFKTAQIKFVGTHAEYNLVDAVTVGNPNESQKRTRKGKG